MSPLEKLALLGLECLNEHRLHMSDVDGGFIHDTAVRAGVLISRQVSNSCGEYCACAGAVEFPTECYFIDDEIKKAAIQLQRST